jgi:hypothetical protein
MDALRGASECMRQFRPMIFLATHGREIHRECCRLLTSWGYQCQRLQDGSAGELGEVVARFPE